MKSKQSSHYYVYTMNVFYNIMYEVENLTIISKLLIDLCAAYHIRKKTRLYAYMTLFGNTNQFFRLQCTGDGTETGYQVYLNLK